MREILQEEPTKKAAEHTLGGFFYQAFPWVANQLSLDWLILMPGPMVDAITQDLMY